MRFKEHNEQLQSRDSFLFLKRFLMRPGVKRTVWQAAILALTFNPGREESYSQNSFTERKADISVNIYKYGAFFLSLLMLHLHFAEHKHGRIMAFSSQTETWKPFILVFSLSSCCAGFSCCSCCNQHLFILSPSSQPISSPVSSHCVSFLSSVPPHSPCSRLNMCVSATPNRAQIISHIFGLVTTLTPVATTQVFTISPYPNSQ